MVFTRGRTAKRRLEIDWDVPVWNETRKDVQRTSSVVHLTKPRAFEFLAGKDKRPLLVMRECRLCAGSDFALLARATRNERTMLLTRWFHCVRLPSTVLHKDHPVHSLFAERHPPHLYVATRDGATVIELPGSQTRSQVWKAMSSILRQTHKSDPNRRVKQLLAMLNDFDNLDEKEAGLRRRLDKSLEVHGPKSAEFKRLRTQFEGLQRMRKKLLAREEKLRDLGIK